MSAPTPKDRFDWLNSALVMIMTMREDDAAHWDPEELVDFAKSMSVDALGFSVQFHLTQHRGRHPGDAQRAFVEDLQTAFASTTAAAAE